MYLIQICIFYRSHFTPARRKAGMRKNSESEVKDALRRVEKTQMKAKGYLNSPHLNEGK